MHDEGKISVSLTLQNLSGLLRGEQMNLHLHYSYSTTDSTGTRFIFWFHRLQDLLMDVTDAVLWAS